MNLDALFQKKELLKTALSLSHHGKPAPYERLEFLGDRVVGLVVSDMLYQMFPNAKEGEMARRLTALVREEALAEVALGLGLDKKLITNEHELRKNASILSDVCEAVLGAMYLDQGLEHVRSFMEPIWTPMIIADKKAPKDPKSALQEWAQGHGHNLPTYEVLEKSGADHMPSFVIEVKIESVGSARATGSSKKTAEQKAAETLLKQVTHG